MIDDSMIEYISNNKLPCILLRFYGYLSSSFFKMCLYMYTHSKETNLEYINLINDNQFIAAVVLENWELFATNVRNFVSLTIISLKFHCKLKLIKTSDSWLNFYILTIYFKCKRYDWKVGLIINYIY